MTATSDHLDMALVVQAIQAQLAALEPGQVHAEFQLPEHGTSIAWAYLTAESATIVAHLRFWQHGSVAAGAARFPEDEVLFDYSQPITSDEVAEHIDRIFSLFPSTGRKHASNAV